MLTANNPEGTGPPPTIIVTNNACAQGIANNTVKQKHSNAIDMSFYWIRDQVKQQQFEVYWQKGTNNLADYFTKHHSASHHQQVQSHYLREKEQPQQQIAHMATQSTEGITLLNQDQLAWLFEPHCEGVLENNTSLGDNNTFTHTPLLMPHYSEPQKHAGNDGSPHSQQNSQYWPLLTSNGQAGTEQIL
jgi:hypothetical protein